MDNKAAGDLVKEKRAEYKTTFDHFDTDKDGKITLAELGNMLRTLCRNVNDAQLADIVKSVDENNNETIEFEEFIVMVTKILEENIDMVHSFIQDFDTNKDGFVDKAELGNAMGHFGFTPEQVDDMLKQADIDGDGKIDYKEFTLMMGPMPLPEAAP